MGKKFEFEFNPFTFDQIREMSEEDLNRNVSIFRRKIKEAIRSGRDTRLYEVEFCYLDHERIMRDRTRKIHDEFVRKNKRFNRRDRKHTERG